MRQAELVRLTVVLAAVIIPAPIAIAQQSQATNSPHFEAASIRPGKADAGVDYRTAIGPPGGQYRIENMPLNKWIELGLSIPEYALKAPAWTENSRFDLDARLPKEPVSRQSLADMLTSLLVERFGLKWHEETQTVSGYELVTDKKVLAQPSTPEERLHPHGAGWGPTSLQGIDMPTSRLAEFLSNTLEKPVVDASHLAGGYDIRLEWRPPDDAAPTARQQSGTKVENLPASVFTAIREQLGLRLQPAKIPSRVIVIDNINPQPTSN